MIRVWTRSLPVVAPVLFALGLGLGALTAPARAAGPAPSAWPASADAALVEAAGLDGAEQAPVPELWQCKIECLKAGREALRACLAEPDHDLRACIERAKGVVQACIDARCADIEPPCPIACLRAAHAEYTACVEAGGTRADCAARHRETLRACIEANCGG